MNNNPLSEKMSFSKKTLTALLVVGILLVSALVINSVQQKTNLQAQASGFSQLLSSIIGTRLEPLKRIPKDDTTISSNPEAGNAIFQSENGGLVFNIENIEGIQSLSIQASSDGEVILPESGDPFGLNSYIVTFKADPLIEKTKDILSARGKKILPGEENKKALKEEILKSKTQIDSHKATIASQQNELITKINTSFGSSQNISGAARTYKTSTGKEVRVRQMKTSINAVTIENVTESELKQITQGVNSIARIEKAQQVKIDLVETPDVINSEDLQQFIGANGVPLTGQGTIVAIVDTGVDYTHQDLGACSFLVEGGCKVAYGYDFVNNDPDPMDDQGHGTHVAATAAGNGYYTQSNGNTQPLLGIAPDATIYAFKVLGASGSGSNLGVIAGIEACADPNGDGDFSDRVTVCSLSLGSANGDPLDATSLAVDAAVDAGVIMTIAAGNDGPGFETIGSPGTSRKAITVGAACKPGDIGSSSCSQAVASFSSRGPVNYIDENDNPQVLNKPDIVSPGVNICAAQWGNWMNERSCLGDGEHIAINGTSMATPTVAGLMALLAQAHPDKTVAELKQVLMSSATDLGLPVTIQGQGLVDGLSALESIGIPNTFVSIGGLPFNVEDTETGQVGTYTKQLTLQNISNQALNITASQVSSNPGVTLSFPASLSIAPGQTKNFEVTVTVNHATALSGSNIKETIALSNGTDVVNVIISRRTPQYVTTSEQALDFGLYHTSLATFSGTLPVTITNRMTDQARTYTLSVDESTISSSAQDNITFTPSVNQITLNPGASTTVNVNLSAFSSSSNLLQNKSYKATLKLVSGTEIVPIEVKFFKGYAFELYYGETEPDFVLLSGPTWQQSYAPNPQEDSLVLKSTTPGPFHAVGVYLDQGPNSTSNPTFIFKHDLGLTGSLGIVTYNVSKNQAEHTIENTYFGNSCVFSFVPESGNYLEGAGFSGGGRYTIEYNTLPENMHFSLICGQLIPANDRIIFSQMYLTEGLNQDFVLNDQTAEISTRYLYGFDNKKGGDELSIGMNLCNFRNFKQNGSIDSGYSSCSFFNNAMGRLTLSEGQTGVIEVRSLHTDTPQTASVPSYPAFKIYALSGDGGNDEYFMYSSPEMFATPEKLYAWTPYTSGVLSTSTSAQNAYQTSKVEVVNDNFITVGTGPVVDTVAVKAFQDDFGFIAGTNASLVSMYQYADGSTEAVMMGNPNPTKADITLSRGGQQVFSQLVDVDKMSPFQLAGTPLPDEEGDLSGSSYGGPVIGNYSATIDRVGKFNGQDQDGVFSSLLNFSIAGNSIDSVPPIIKNIQLVADGILQNHFDPASPGVLNIYLDPGKGIQSHNLVANSSGAYTISFMSDQITNVDLFAGNSYQELTELPTPVLQDGKYVADLSSLTGSVSGYKYFKLVATDSAGNTIQYKFIIEVGESLDQEEIADEFLLVCVQNPPLLQFTPQVPVLTNPNNFIPIQMSVINQDTTACSPRSFHFRARANFHPPLNTNPNNQRLRIVVSSNSLPNPTVQTTEGIYSSPSLTPGQVHNKTIYMRPDSALANGTYLVGMHWIAGSLPTTAVLGDLSFPVQVGNSVNPPSCTANTTNVTFSPLQPTVDSGGPTTAFNFTVTNNDSSPCSPSNFSLSFDTDQFPGSISGTKKIRGSATNSSSFTTTEFSVASGSLNPGQSYTGTGYLRTDNYFPNGSYQIGATLTDTTNNQTQTVPFTVTINGAESEPVCTANTTNVTFSPLQPTVDSGGPTTAFNFTVTNNDSSPCSPSNFSLSFDTDQFPGSISGTKKIRGSATNSSSFTTTEFSVASGSLNPGQSYTGTGYLRTDNYFPNGSYQIGATLTDTTNNQTQTVPFTVTINGAETEPSGTCTRNPVTITPIGLIASHPNTETSTKAYQLSITNNDTVGCPNTTFKVLITDPLDGFGLGKSNLVLPANNKFEHFWSLAPGQTQVKNVFYRNFGSIIDQSVSLLIQVSDITSIGAGSTHSTVNLNGSINYGTPQ